MQQRYVEIVTSQAIVVLLSLLAFLLQKNCCEDRSSRIRQSLSSETRSVIVLMDAGRDPLSELMVFIEKSCSPAETR